VFSRLHTVNVTSLSVFLYSYIVQLFQKQQWNSQTTVDWKLGLTGAYWYMTKEGFR
jgi:hypothetical protein